MPQTGPYSIRESFPYHLGRLFVGMPVREIAAEKFSKLASSTALVVHQLGNECSREVFQNVCDLDNTIEDIDVGEHSAVLGGGRTRWFKAHVLQLYADHLG